MGNLPMAIHLDAVACLLFQTPGQAASVAVALNEKGLVRELVRTHAGTHFAVLFSALGNHLARQVSGHIHRTQAGKNVQVGLVDSPPL